MWIYTIIVMKNLWLNLTLTLYVVVLKCVTNCLQVGKGLGVGGG